MKPHASPVLHAIEYLLGRLDRSYLTRLRDFGGLQSYPSRTKDPYPVDYSTGSVGLGSAAPLFGALADRFVADAARHLDRRPLHLAARRRRARRGQHLGGAGGSADAPARERALDRRPQPAVARPRDPRDPGGRARGAVPDERLGRDRAQVRAAPPRGVRPRRRRAAAPPDRRDAERAVPGALRRLRGGRARHRPRRRAGRPSAPRSSVCSRTTPAAVGLLVRDLGGHDLADVLDALRPRARDDRPSDGDLRLHDQGLRARDRRAARRTTRPCSTATRSSGSAHGRPG